MLTLASLVSMAVAGFENQFALTSFDPDPYGIPYDYYSIMHYPKNASAKPGTITIETLDKKYQDVIGNQGKPSKWDYKRICSMYKCDNCMGDKKEPQETCNDENPFSCYQALISRRLHCYGKDDAVKCCETCREVKKQIEERI